MIGVPWGNIMREQDAEIERLKAENARLKDTLRETFSELARLENEQWRDRVYSPLR